MTASHEKWSRFWTMAKEPMSTRMPVVRVLWTFWESMKRPDILFFGAVCGGLYLLMSSPPLFPTLEPLYIAFIPLCAGIVVALVLVVLGGMRVLQTGVLQEVTPPVLRHFLRTIILLTIAVSFWWLYRFVQATATGIAEYRSPF